MSVRMTVEILVNGTDDDLAVEDAMAARSMQAWHELESSVWLLLREAGIDTSEVDIETIGYDSEPAR